MIYFAESYPQYLVLSLRALSFNKLRIDMVIEIERSNQEQASYSL